MIVTYLKIINQPAMELKTQTKLGNVAEVIFNKTNFRVSGILVQAQGFTLFNKPMVISAADIVEISPQAVIANDEDALSNLEETVRLKEAVKDKYFGIDQKVYTKSGRRLGKVIDLYIDSDSMVITKLLIKGVMSERLIPTSHVTEIKGKRITVRDDFELAKGAPAMAQMMI